MKRLLLIPLLALSACTTTTDSSGTTTRRTDTAAVNALVDAAIRVADAYARTRDGKQMNPPAIR